MIEAYKIAVNMTLTGDAHKKMMDFSKLIEKTALQMDKLLRHMKGLGTNFNLLKAETHSSTSAMRAFDLSLTSTARHAAQATTQVSRLTHSTRQLNAVQRQGGGGGGVATPGLMGMAGGAIASRLAPAALGYGAFRLGKSSFESGAEFEKKIGQLVQRGYSPDEISDVRGWVKSQNIKGVSRFGMLDAYVDALMATADSSKAKFLAPTLARGQIVAAGTYGGMSHHQQQELVRFAEFRGGGNAEKIQEQLELGMQMMALSGGSIKPAQLRALTKYGGGAVSKLSNAAMIGLEPVLQMRGGSSTGTALQTMALQLIGGQMSTAKGASLTSLGMFDKGSIKHDTTGRTLGSKFGTFKYAELLQNDPFAFLMEKYIPALKKQGVTSPEKIEQRIQYDFSRTASQILISMYENSDKIIRTLAAAGQLQKGTQAYESFMKTPTGAATNVSAAWENFKLALDKLTSPSVTKGLNAAAYVLDKIAASFEVMANDRGMVAKSTSNYFTAGSQLFGSTTSPAPSSNNKEIRGDVNLDGMKVGTWMSKYITGNPNVARSTFGDNFGYGGVSTAVTSVPGTQPL